jgi:hypothetical protein
MKLPSGTARRSCGRRTFTWRRSAAAQSWWESSVLGSPPVRSPCSAERPPDTTTQSQPDPQRDPRPGTLDRRAAALAAHRETVEERGQGAARRGCGQGARQSPRASAGRHRQGRHCLVELEGYRDASGYSGTRLVAVFHSRMADSVAPVRSIRPVDIPLLSPIHALIRRPGRPLSNCPTSVPSYASRPIRINMGSARSGGHGESDFDRRCTRLTTSQTRTERL